MFSATKPSPNVRCNRRASIMPPPPARAPRTRGRRALPLPPQLLAVHGRHRTPDRPEGRPGVVRRTGVGGVLGRHIQRPALTVFSIGEVQVRPMSIRGIPMTLAGALTTATRG